MTSGGKVPVSVVVITQNEELSLPDCLRSLAPFDEVFVVDSDSTDRTVAIAEAAKATVARFDWNGRYPKKKQWALENLPFRHDWVLFLDADERVSGPLADEIADFVQSGSPAVAMDMALCYRFLGRRLKHGHRVVKRMLVDRRHCHYPPIDDLEVTNMWHVEGHYHPVANGPKVLSRTMLDHEDLDPLYGWFSRHNRYSDWEAYLRVHQRPRHQVARLRSRRGRWLERLPGKPLSVFLYSYLLKQGWRDGRAGFQYAMAQAFYYWQIYLKTVELKQSAQHQLGRGRG